MNEGSPPTKAPAEDTPDPAVLFESFCLWLARTVGEVKATARGTGVLAMTESRDVSSPQGPLAQSAEPCLFPGSGKQMGEALSHPHPPTICCLSSHSPDPAPYFLAGWGTAAALPGTFLGFRGTEQPRSWALGQKDSVYSSRISIRAEPEARGRHLTDPPLAGVPSSAPMAGLLQVNAASALGLATAALVDAPTSEAHAKRQHPLHWETWPSPLCTRFCVACSRWSGC